MPHDANATPQAETTQGKYAPVNNLNLYYEIHGDGPPLVLIHGGLGTIAAHWSELLPAFAQTHQVIAVELQGHGHTADVDRPLRYESMADDVAALLPIISAFLAAPMPDASNTMKETEHE